MGSELRAVEFCLARFFLVNCQGIEAGNMEQRADIVIVED